MDRKLSEMLPDNVKENSSLSTRFKPFTELEDEDDKNKDSSLQVLDPNHPMLQKFQQTLREHLQKQIEHLSGEVFEMESGAKKQHAIREQLGIETYEAQQQVNKQQDTIRSSVKELQFLTDEREALDAELQVIKTKHYERKHELFKTQNDEIQLRNESEELEMLKRKLLLFEESIESELTINQRVFEKTKKDKEQFVQEKRDLDLIVYRLMSENFRIETELETLDMQLRVKELEREQLAENVTNCNVELETIDEEIRFLIQQCNTVLNAIAIRDKNLSGLRKDLLDIDEKIKTTNCEVQKTQKLSKEEMEENEKLTVLLARINEMIENCENRYEAENTKRNVLDGEMFQNQSIIEQIDKDIKRIETENGIKKATLNIFIKEFEVLSQKKLCLEEQIVRNLEDKITSTKAEKNLNKLVRESQEATREKEINLARQEKLQAKLLMDIESQKCFIDETQRFLDELEKQRFELENEGKTYSTQLEKLTFITSRKQRDINILSAKIDTIIARTGAVNMSPLEIKMKSLEKSIKETRDANKDCQNFWLRQQSNFLHLSEERQRQIKELTKLRTQLLLIDQKNLKIGDELESYKKQIESRNRSIGSLQNYLSIQNEKLNRTRDSKESIDKNNYFMHNEYMGKLQEAEMDLINIESEIKLIEQEKIVLSDELLDVNREVLIWEKKIKLAIETKTNMEKERGEGGEIGTMKAEIHRMHVRLSQLKKAQDKLVADLEHCVSRRDAIITVAEAREKKSVGGTERTRMNFTRKMDDLRNSIKKTQNDIEKMQKEIGILQEQEEIAEKEFENLLGNLKSIREETKRIDEEMETLNTNRQKNLEILLVKQRKLQLYTDVAKKRNPFLTYRTESTIRNEVEKSKNLNGKLLLVMENLLNDFPHHYHEIIRIFNTLKVPSMHL